MAYIGKQPVVGNFVKLDAITTSATATYNLLNGGVAYYPQTANNCIVSLNGVIQSPTSAYTISGSTIVFDSALTSSDSIDFILVLGDVLSIGTPSDSTVSLAKLTATGTKDATTFLRGDNTFATVSTTPTIQRFTSSSGTYTTPSGVKYLIVEMSGAGGGGAGGAVGSQSTAGGNGGNTTFGTSLHTAGGGAGGASAWTGSGGIGGGLTLGAGATSIFTHGGTVGGGAGSSSSSATFSGTGAGGGNPFNGGGLGNTYISAGAAGIANTGGGGSGGGGGSSSGSVYAGSGGGGGGYMKFLISSPSATYAYAIGSGGTAGTGGSGSNGGAGGSGIIIVTEHYN